MVNKKNIYLRYSSTDSWFDSVTYGNSTSMDINPKYIEASLLNDKSICFMEQTLYFLLPYIFFSGLVKAYFSWAIQNMWSYFSCENIFLNWFFTIYFWQTPSNFYKKIFIPKNFYAPDVLLLLLAGIGLREKINILWIIYLWII